MRDCVCAWLIEKSNSFEEALDKYNKRAKHLVTEHKVNGFYVPSSLMLNDNFDVLMVALFELSWEYDIYIVIFSKNEEENEKAKHYFLDEEFRPIEFEVHDFLDVYRSCQYDFEKSNIKSRF